MTCSCGVLGARRLTGEVPEREARVLLGDLSALTWVQVQKAIVCSSFLEKTDHPSRGRGMTQDGLCLVLSKPMYMCCIFYVTVTPEDMFLQGYHGKVLGLFLALGDCSVGWD